MEYLLTQFNLLITTILLMMATALGVSTETPIQSTDRVGTSTAYVTNVIDGDTIDVRLEGQSNTIRVRYIGIDTPEPYATKIPECGSAEATNRNIELVSGQTVSLVPGLDPYDKYNRLLAYVYVGNVFVNESLVTDGYATVLMMAPNTMYKEQFSDAYYNAYTSKRGIWATCSSKEGV